MVDPLACASNKKFQYEIVYRSNGKRNQVSLVDLAACCTDGLATR